MHLPPLLLPLFGALCSSATSVRSPRPLVLWHGLGDSYASDGMVQFGELIKEIHAGIFIHSIYIVDNNDDDRKACFYGNVNTQLAGVAKQLSDIPELSTGFDAIGFSQGGQFLRAYVERYNDPPIHNLITFGSQHMGVSDMPACSAWDLLCRAARGVALGAAYSAWVQDNIVMAQYFRDPSNIQTYLNANHFLPDVNNEIPGQRNSTYADNFASLNALVLLLFDQDKTVVPKESAWFGTESIPDDGAQRVLTDKTIIPMRSQPLYTEDWIGLRQLDERGAVILGTCDGEHMQMNRACWEPVVKQWVGGMD
ncbi:palmitoyl-protein thioesterase [Hymenopellis radicata]|nr:palmitoyl-protein thioesterase [Hymenopellis radicata]